MSFVDFEAVKAANPIEKVAERLGLELKKSGHQLRGPCPSGEGGERALVVTPSKSVWYSFALEKGGDVLALVQQVNGGSAKEAAQFLSGDTVPLEKRSTRQSNDEGEERGFRPLEYLDPNHAAVEALGVSSEEATALGWGYAPRGILRGKVAVPIRTEDGTLAGYIGIEEVTLPPKWEL